MNKLLLNVVIAVTVGMLFAGTATKLTYPCPSFVATPTSGCLSIEKSIMHPADLIKNKQNSLTKFAREFAVSSLVVFTLLSLYGYIQAKKKTKTD